MGNCVSPGGKVFVFQPIYITTHCLWVNWSNTAFSCVHSVWIDWRYLMPSKKWIRALCIPAEVIHGVFFRPGAWVLYHRSRVRKVAFLCVFPFLFLSKVRSADFATSENVHNEDEESLNNNQSINQSISQSVSQSVNQPTNQPTNQPINQSINQSINQLVGRSVGRSINQSINQSVSQSITQSINRTLLSLVEVYQTYTFITLYGMAF